MARLPPSAKPAPARLRRDAPLYKHWLCYTQTAAELADCLRRRIGLLGPDNPVVYHNIRPLAAAEDGAAASKDVRREPRAGDGVTKGQGT